jgi:hypothetical protein
MTQQSMGARRFLAGQEIDQAAGEARGRHQTLAPGQEMIYSTKLAQAQAYIAAQAADAGAAVPAYVAAEVEAMGGTALAAAQCIVAAAEAFHTGAGPQIERARRAGKLAVQQAATADAVQLALAAALQALNEI